MMNPGEETGEQSRPAAETPAAGPGNSGPRRRGGRGGRGRGRGRGFGGPRSGENRERPKDGPAAEEGQPVHQGDSHGHGAPKNASLHDVIKQVERIRGDLTRVLEEMNHVLNLLDQIERENNASEQDIHKLRESVQSMRSHGNSGPRIQRRPEPQPPSTPTDEAAPENEAAEEWD